MKTESFKAMDKNKYIDHLKKIYHKTTMGKNITKFEELINKIPGLQSIQYIDTVFSHSRTLGTDTRIMLWLKYSGDEEYYASWDVNSEKIFSDFKLCQQMVADCSNAIEIHRKYQGRSK